MADREGLPLAMPVCATRFFRISLEAKVAFKPMALWAGSRPTLKRHHPNPDELDWGDGGWAGRSADGAFFFVFMFVCALVC
jgi:hypothetical protein